MDKRFNVTIKILLVLWMVFCIGGAIVMCDDISSALNDPERLYPIGMGSLGWHYESLQNYIISGGIWVSWFALGAIISISAWKYPKYRTYVLLHYIATCIYVIWINSQYS